MGDFEELKMRIRKVYDSFSQRNVLMSALGTALQHEGLELPPGYKLSDVLNRMDDLIMFSDEQNPLVKYVYSTSEKEKKPPLRRSLLRAFTIPCDQNVYFKKTQPYKFCTDTNAPSEDFVEVPSKYRLQELDPYNMSESEEEKIRKNIEDWAQSEKIPDDVIYYISKMPQKNRNSTAEMLKRTMLYKLLKSQSPEILPHLCLPGDIVLLLASTEVKEQNDKI